MVLRDVGEPHSIERLVIGDVPPHGGRAPARPRCGRRRFGFEVAVAGATLWLNDRMLGQGEGCRVSISLAPTQHIAGLYTPKVTRDQIRVAMRIARETTRVAKGSCTPQPTERAQSLPSPDSGWEERCARCSWSFDEARAVPGGFTLRAPTVNLRGS